MGLRAGFLEAALRLTTPPGLSPPLSLRLSCVDMIRVGRGGGMDDSKQAHKCHRTSKGSRCSCSARRSTPSPCGGRPKPRRCPRLRRHRCAHGRPHADLLLKLVALVPKSCFRDVQRSPLGKGTASPPVQATGAPTLNPKNPPLNPKP